MKFFSVFFGPPFLGLFDIFKFLSQERGQFHGRMMLITTQNGTCLGAGVPNTAEIISAAIQVVHVTLGPAGP